MTFLGQQKLEMLKSLFINFSVILSDCWMVLCDGSGYWMIFDEWFLNEYVCVMEWCLNDLTCFLIDFWIILCDGVVSEWFLNGLFCDFKMTFQQFLFDFVWKNGSSGLLHDLILIFEWLCVMEWFLMIWKDFEIILCGGNGFETVLDDFAMICECFCVVERVLEWISNCFLICDSKMILCDGVGIEWFLNVSWMILCDGGALEWFLNDWLVTFDWFSGDYAWWNGFWKMFEQFLLVFPIIFEWVCHRMLSCHLLMILPDFVWCSCFFFIALTIMIV